MFLRQNVTKIVFTDDLSQNNGPKRDLERYIKKVAERRLKGGCWTKVFSNQLLEDLERLWELRFIIPDPCNPHGGDEK